MRFWIAVTLGVMAAAGAAVALVYVFILAGGSR